MSCDLSTKEGCNKLKKSISSKFMPNNKSHGFINNIGTNTCKSKKEQHSDEHNGMMKTNIDSDQANVQCVA